MSSFSSFPPTGTGFGPQSSAPSSTGTASASSNQNNNGDAATNATLYPTLVLLLAVSSAIVVRSLILRRRHQRLVEEAIRTGTWLPNRLDPSTSRRRRDIGQKPQLWEVFLHPAGGDGDPHEDEMDEKRKWNDVQPFSAAYAHSPTSSPQGPVSGSAENAVDPPSRPSRFVRPFARRSPPSPPQSNTMTTVGQSIPLQPSSSPNSSPLVTASAPPAVRATVLIAMPSHPSSRRRLSKSGEAGLPVVEIGVAEANVLEDGAEASTMAPRHSSVS